MADSPFYISEITFGDNGYVVVTNGGPEAADPTGLKLCQFPEYPDVPSGEIAASASVKVAASAFGGLDAAKGEMGLYSNSEFENPESVIAYVEWGEPGHKREEPASKAGKWTPATFLDTIGCKSIKASAGAKVVEDWTNA